MEKMLSKRAKVQSDKPAYKEKKKTDKGYVWTYDEKHIEKRWKLKQEKLKKLEKNIGKVRKEYEKDLVSDDLRDRAIAAVVGVMDDTAMRVGNEESAKESDTYGATTLKVKHMTISGGKARFKFPGKGSINQDTTVENSKVVKVLKELVKDKKKDDFIFEIDGKKVLDRAVNRYLSKFDISAKDIRGFQANRIMKDVLKKQKDFEKALEEVADIVGHEPSTLKTQYLDPELVEKHESKEKKDKKAFLSIRAQDETLSPSSIERGTGIKEVDEEKKKFPLSTVEESEILTAYPNRNIGNVLVKADRSEYPELLHVWRIIAPFLPEGAFLTSTYRDDFDQAGTILRYWLIKWWGKPDHTKTKGSKLGFFQTKFGESEGVPIGTLRKIYIKTLHKKWPLTKANLWWIEKIRKFMSQYDPEKHANPQGGPKESLDLARVGESAHRHGVAFDISGVNPSKVREALLYVAQVFPQNLRLGKHSYETGNNAYHVELSHLPSMPDKNQWLQALRHYQNKGEFFAKRQRHNPPLSKRARLTEEDAAWVESIKQRPISYRSTQPAKSDIRKSIGMGQNVKVNQLLLNAWLTLRPFLPASAKMTSGMRTPEDQKRILGDYWYKATGKRIPQHLYSDDRVWGRVSSLLKRHHGYIVGPPWTNKQYAHLKGNALDISGANLYDIAGIVEAVSRDSRLPVKFRKPLIEHANNAVHVGIENAQFDKDAITKILGHEFKYARIISKRAYEEFEDIEDDDVGVEMGFGIDDMLGDWFEKSPDFRFREEEDVPEFDLHDVGDSKAESMAKDDPEKFFYDGLHKEHQDLEVVALEKMIEDNPKFYFIFKYHTREDDEKILGLLEKASELLSQKDPRAFFYYRLHHKFPELGRGAIVHLIDKDPRSFSQLGLDKDYPDYEQIATDAINVYDATVVEIKDKE